MLEIFEKMTLSFFVIGVLPFLFLITSPSSMDDFGDGVFANIAGIIFALSVLMFLVSIPMFVILAVIGIWS